MRRSAAHLALLVGVAILTGCGGGDEGGGAGGTTAGAAPSGAIAVSATDFAFTPSELAAEAGPVEIELANDSESPHAIAIAGNGVDAASDTIQGGETTTLSVELAEGTYEIYCPVDGHRELGMTGTLTVGAGGPGPTETDDGGGGGSRY